MFNLSLSRAIVASSTSAEDRDYCAGVLAAFLPRTDSPARDDDSVSDRLLSRSPEFWRGYLDSRASVGLYKGREGRDGPLKPWPSVQVKDDPAVLASLVEAIDLTYAPESADDPLSWSPREFEDWKCRVDRGRLHLADADAWRAISAFYSTAPSVVMSRRHERVREEILAWRPAAKKKPGRPSNKIDLTETATRLARRSEK